MIKSKILLSTLVLLSSFTYQAKLSKVPKKSVKIYISDKHYWSFGERPSIRTFWKYMTEGKSLIMGREQEKLTINKIDSLFPIRTNGNILPFEVAFVFRNGEKVDTLYADRKLYYFRKGQQDFIEKSGALYKAFNFVLD